MDEVHDGHQISGHVAGTDLTSALLEEGEVKITSVSELADRPDITQKSEYPDAKWFRAEGVPGDGDVPEWHDPTKYPTVEDQAKAAHGLRQQLSQRQQAAERAMSVPDNYEVNVSQDLKDAGGDINQEDPFFGKFVEVAKQNGYTQDQFDAALNLHLSNYMAEVTASEESSNADMDNYIEEQLKELGPNGNQRVQDVTNFIQNSGMPDDLKEIAAQNVDSAEMVRVFEYLRDAMNVSSVPGNIPTSATPNKTHEELQKMLADPRFTSSAEYQKRVFDGYAELRKRQETGV